ncbi:hypothetical protein JCGZ_21674 [Jatropha curcas]|uniref:X8 domain-containing protein n=1 Tax=Jatropha curcas TaxID=180498 RepID=A0A067JEP3_JATCU|nr:PLASMODESMATA CALLOSE-BINDING PROTEIN 1 [Jatropha curcas]KDP21203.1 hypothetical protein JCGZ_21674 [Jatropha curcas]
MGSEVFQYFSIFLFYLLLNSGTNVAETPPLEGIQKTTTAENQEDQIFFSPSVFATQLDDTGAVPIVNPTTPGTGTTTPGTGTGTITPIIESPPPPPSGITTPQIPPTATTPTPTTSGGSWCIASPTASETALQVALDYACGYGGADCSAIQPGASCYNPNTLRDHASYAFNQYYQKNPVPTSCVFGGTAQLSSTDPSNGNCHYASPTSTPSVTPPANPTPTPPTITTSPTTMTPPLTTTPSGPTVYGVAEPTGLPSSATSVSCSLLLLCSATAIIGSLLAASHI